MIFQFLRRLGGGDAAGGKAEAADPVEYEGYRIIAAPRKEAAGWRVMGTITREVDGEPRVHEFIRADVYAGRDDALSITVAKAKRIIDEQGVRLFEPR